MSKLDIKNGLVQWGSDNSSQDTEQPFSFDENFTDIPMVVNTRTGEDSENTLPILRADKSMFYIDRKDSINRNERFHWFAVASNQNGGTKVATIEDGKGNAVGKIQWGSSTSSKDGDQSFSFHQSFSKNCAFVITNRNKKGVEDIMPVISKNTGSFTVNRNDGISGDESFSWIAIGDVEMDNNTFSIDFGDKFTMKGGRAKSSSDNAQSYTFTSLGLEPFSNSCDIVLTQRTAKNAECVMPVTEEDKNFFTCNRDGTIDGEEYFDWIAIGK